MSTCAEESEEFSWKAFSIKMAQLPLTTSKVLYFPQGHIESFGNLDLSNCPSLPAAYITCRVSKKKHWLDKKTEEIFQTLTLMPLSGDEPDFDSDITPDPDTRLIFSKTLSQSDVNNSEEFSVSKHCAETIFPSLDYHHRSPGQTIAAQDVRRKVWKFSHVYRGVVKGHFLTKGWSEFMKDKKLVAGNLIMLYKTENAIMVCIKRCKKVDWSGRVKGGDVIEAMNRAARREEFDVVHCTLDIAPACVVWERLVKPKLKITWCPGMRVKSASSEFTGTIVSVDDADPARWPDSPWMRLQVRWDEAGLIHNVTRVSPWQLELLPPVFKQVIGGQVKYLVRLSHIEAERRGDKIENPSEGSSSGVNQPEQSPGEGSSEQPPGEGSSEQSPGEGSSEQSPGEGSSEQPPGEGSLDK